MQLVRVSARDNRGSRALVRCMETLEPLHCSPVVATPPKSFYSDGRSREIVMRYVVAILVLLSGISSSLAQSHMGTPQEQQACSRDASRFCRQQLGNDSAVQQCLQQNRSRLSRSCQKVFASHGM